MYTKLLWLVVAATIWVAPSAVLAREPEDPPLVYVNGEASQLNPVNFSSLPDLALPVDNAPQVYLINTTISFSLDEEALPLFPEQISQYEFSWDFGDSTKGTGLSLEHTYTEPGTYTVTTSMKQGGAEPIELTTMGIHIVPSSNYVLPKPIISVNGILTKDPITDSIQAALTRKVVLDATKSKAGSSPIVSFIWDLGNRQLSNDGKVTVTYDNLFSTVQPVVRITDKNNLHVDATVELANATLPNPDGSIPEFKSPPDEMSLPLKLFLAFLVLISPTLLTRYFTSKKR